MRHNVVVRQDITGNFLKERVRFNRFGLLLQLLLRHVSSSVREGDACQDCKQTELLPAYRQQMILIDHLFYFCAFRLVLCCFSKICGLLCYDNRALAIIAVKVLHT